MLQFKEGVQLTVTKEVNEILRGVEAVFNQFHVPCVVTAGTDGVHGKQSKHYSGKALDFRIRDLTAEQRDTLVQLCQESLIKGHDVVLEHDHLHVELDPHTEQEPRHGR